VICIALLTLIKFTISVLRAKKLFIMAIKPNSYILNLSNLTVLNFIKYTIFNIS